MLSCLATRGFVPRDTMLAAVLILVVVPFVATGDPLPVVLWHGMGDVCCSPFSLGKVTRLIQQEIPGVYVRSLSFGGSTSEDLVSGYFGNVNQQVAEACSTVASDPRLRDGFHAIGFSQGGQFLRALAQRCPQPPMRNLITLGAQHQGVSAFPRCPSSSPPDSLCRLSRKLINKGAYTTFIQRHSVQAQYWHDPLNQESYRAHSLFLADINNERQPRNHSYADHLSRLQHLVLVQFAGDTMVTPRESALFGFYVPGQTVRLLAMNETDLYLEDRIGLRLLDHSNRIVTYVVPGDHLQLDMKWFVDELVTKYLKS